MKTEPKNKLVNLFEDGKEFRPEPIFSLKDMIHYIVLFVTMVVFYFTNIKDVEVRIAILETKLSNIEQMISEVKKDQRELIDVLRNGR